ncbi:MAG: GYD domain protein [Euryarchaeota archaeon]|nr:GYD domain protein [Euryarchaeota archaeon]OUW22864.1 MAG: hypothetical protein CBD33_00845 [Euryarchaeota archaeon TMED173]|tara:strand:+ start:928 stop:1287 length:360 start_codon:yes stop_codon:yes gene_type:complete
MENGNISIPQARGMPKYMYSGNYTREGASGLLQEGGKARKEEAQRIIEAMGGNLESYYWTFGEMDFFMIADMPESMAVKFSLHVGASGVFNGKLTPLITVDDMEDATSTDLPSMRLPGQ